MNPKRADLFFGVVLLFVLTANLIRAQDSQATLSGTVTDSSGKALSNAKVTVKNSSTGQATETQTDAAGQYLVPNLPSGAYEVSASADGIGVGVAKVALAPGGQTLNLTVRTVSAAPAEALPKASPRITPSEPQGSRVPKPRAQSSCIKPWLGSTAQA
jgi:hypothetical protein